MKPRVLFVSRERFRLPLDGTQRVKWDAVAEELDYRIVAAAQQGSPTRSDRAWLAGPVRPRFADGPVYYAALPARIAHELRAFDPDVAVVQGVHEAAAFRVARALTRSRTKLLLDVQGDWRGATRLYGSALRRLLNPLNDALGLAAVRSADGIRTISPFTSTLVRRLEREPLGEFAPFVDRDAFAGPPAPLPERPRVLFVGVLERVKGFDTLAAAWPRVRELVPSATLHVVGRGRLAPLARDLVAGGCIWVERLDAAGVVAAMDEATALCLPSRSEGLGRVVVEAMLRGRPVVGADAGGIPDLVEHEVTGLLAVPGDPSSLAAELARVLVDRDLAARMGANARRKGEEIGLSAGEFASRLAAVVRDMTAG